MPTNRVGRLRICRVLIALAAVAAFPSCNNESKGNDNSTALIQIGDSILTQEVVVAQIPVGLSPDDSVAMFQAIVDRWVEEQMLFNLAEENISHLGDLEKKVEAYRRSLIVNEYRKKIVAGRMSPVSEDSVRRYYERNKGDMLLDHPLVKGVYLKIDDSADRIPQIKKWVFDASPESADKIEKYGLKNALEYDYFVDRWVDWQTIADQIPYRFDNPAEFVKKNSEFQTEAGGSIYFLKVTEYLSPGDTIPFDFASTRIREMLMLEQKNTVNQEFFKQLYQKGVKDNKIIPIRYNPLTHSMIENTDKQK